MSQGERMCATSSSRRRIVLEVARRHREYLKRGRATLPYFIEDTEVVLIMSCASASRDSWWLVGLGC